MIDPIEIEVDLRREIFNRIPLTLNQFDRGVPIKVKLYDNGVRYIIKDDEQPIVEFNMGQVGYIMSGTSITDIVDNQFTMIIDRVVTINAYDGSFNVALVDKKTGITKRKGSFAIPLIVKCNSITDDTLSEDVAASIIETLENNLVNATEAEKKLLEVVRQGSLDSYLTRAEFKPYKAILDAIDTKIDNAISGNNKKIYPLHSLKMTFDNVNPGTYITGTTWTLQAKGCTLIGVNPEDKDFKTARMYGGSKTHTHRSGTLVADIGAVNGDLGTIGYNAVNPLKPRYNRGIAGSGMGDIASKQVNHGSSVSGSTEASSSMPPYVTCYIWERTK